MLQCRTLDAADLDQVVSLFDRLSSTSRYLRFFSPAPKAAATTLRHLVSTDRGTHESVGVFEADVLVGAAHHVRSAEAPGRAEISLEVADSHQRRGLGSLLLRELPRVARRHGIDEFTAAALGENRAVQSLLRRSGWPVVSPSPDPSWASR